MKLNEHFPRFDSLPQRILISSTDDPSWSHPLYIYNPTDQLRIELIQILIDTHQVSVTSNEQLINECQIDPKWSDKQFNTVENDQFEVNSIDRIDL